MLTAEGAEILAAMVDDGEYADVSIGFVSMLAGTRRLSEIQDRLMRFDGEGEWLLEQECSAGDD